MIIVRSSCLEHVYILRYTFFFAITFHLNKTLIICTGGYELRYLHKNEIIRLYIDVLINATKRDCFI